MAIPANVLQAYFHEYRFSPMAKKKFLVDILMGFEPGLERQRELLVSALSYDSLNPVADGKENILRCSEISVALFKRVFKYLPQEMDREAFLISVLSHLPEESKQRLSQRQYTTKTGEQLTKTIVPFSIAYHLFLTMVFFDTSELSAADFSRYSALLMEIQAFKSQLRYDNTDTNFLESKLHNAITHLEQFKLGFLKEQYGLTIEMLSNACQSLYLKPEALAIKKDGNVLASVETSAERLQSEVLLELNKRAYGLDNTFGKLKLNEAKPRALSDKMPKVPALPASSEGALSFWHFAFDGGSARGNHKTSVYTHHFAP
jgi:hypothetical protein